MDYPYLNQATFDTSPCSLPTGLSSCQLSCSYPDFTSSCSMSQVQAAVQYRYNTTGHTGLSPVPRNHHNTFSTPSTPTSNTPSSIASNNSNSNSNNNNNNSNNNVNTNGTSSSNNSNNNNNNNNNSPTGEIFAAAAAAVSSSFFPLFFSRPSLTGDHYRRPVHCSHIGAILCLSLYRQPIHLTFYFPPFTM